MTYLFLAGFAALVAGIAMIYAPAAFIVGGAILCAVALRVAQLQARAGAPVPEPPADGDE